MVKTMIPLSREEALKLAGISQQQQKRYQNLYNSIPEICRPVAGSLYHKKTIYCAPYPPDVPIHFFQGYGEVPKSGINFETMKSKNGGAGYWSSRLEAPCTFAVKSIGVCFIPGPKDSINRIVSTSILRFSLNSLEEHVRGGMMPFERPLMEMFSVGDPQDTSLAYRSSSDLSDWPITIRSRTPNIDTWCDTWCASITGCFRVYESVEVCVSLYGMYFMGVS